MAGGDVPVGSREDLARRFGCLRGALSRKGGVLVIGETPGKVRFASSPRLSEVWVPILPDIYYSPRVEEEYGQGRCYGFDGSLLGAGDLVFNRDLLLPGTINYIHGFHYCI